MKEIKTSCWKSLGKFPFSNSQCFDSWQAETWVSSTIFPKHSKNKVRPSKCHKLWAWSRLTQRSAVAEEVYFLLYSPIASGTYRSWWEEWRAPYLLSHRISKRPWPSPPGVHTHTHTGARLHNNVQYTTMCDAFNTFCTHTSEHISCFWQRCPRITEAPTLWNLSHRKDRDSQPEVLQGALLLLPGGTWRDCRIAWLIKKIELDKESK